MLLVWLHFIVFEAMKSIDKRTVIIVVTLLNGPLLEFGHKFVILNSFDLFIIPTFEYTR